MVTLCAGRESSLAIFLSLPDSRNFCDRPLQVWVLGVRKRKVLYALWPGCEPAQIVVAVLGDHTELLQRIINLKVRLDYKSGSLRDAAMYYLAYARLQDHDNLNRFTAIENIPLLDVL